MELQYLLEKVTSHPKQQIRLSSECLLYEMAVFRDPGQETAMFNISSEIIYSFES